MITLTIDDTSRLVALSTHSTATIEIGGRAEVFTIAGISQIARDQALIVQLRRVDGSVAWIEFRPIAKEPPE